jgi:hypothetical protein
MVYVPDTGRGNRQQVYAVYPRSVKLTSFFNDAEVSHNLTDGTMGINS